MYKVILNLCMKCWTDGAKLDRSKTNQVSCHQIVTWDQLCSGKLHSSVAILHWCFRTNYESSFKGQEIQREQSTTEINWQGLLFWDFAHQFGSRLCFCLQTNKQLTWWTHRFSCSDIGRHRNNNLIRYAPEDRSSPTVIPGIWLLEN